MKYIVTVNGKKYEVEVEREDGGKKLLTRSSSAAAPIERISTTPVAAAPILAAPIKETAPAREEISNPQAAPVPIGEGNVVTSPLPGSIFDIKVNVGDAVKSGQVLIVIEAMKMETEIVAPTDGVVVSVLVKKGDAVETDASLVILN